MSATSVEARLAHVDELWNPRTASQRRDHTAYLHMIFDASCEDPSSPPPLSPATKGNATASIAAFALALAMEVPNVRVSVFSMSMLKAWEILAVLGEAFVATEGKGEFNVNAHTGTELTLVSVSDSKDVRVIQSFPDWPETPPTFSYSPVCTVVAREPEVHVHLLH